MKKLKKENKKTGDLFKVEDAKSLTGRFRRFVHNPHRLLRPYIKSGMKVLDFGCGPGLFTIGMAELVGKNGKVIAADLQQGMLDLVKRNIKGTEFEPVIKLHKCTKNKIGLPNKEKLDFVLAFYVLHEVPNREKTLKELLSLMNDKSKIFIVEPRTEVSSKEFEKTVALAKGFGLKEVSRPIGFISRGIVMEK